MAEADDSEDHIAKEKAKYHYRKKRWDSRSKTWKRVGTLIKQPEPYETSYGSIITGEHKPEYKKRIKKIGRKKKYANAYTKKY